MEEGTAQQHKSSKTKREWLLPYQFKKGQSGNPSGRKAGKSLKEYAKEMLACMTDDERQEFMHGMPKEIIWKLAEGNPESKTDVTTNGEKITINNDQFERVIRTRADKLGNKTSGDKRTD